MIAGSATACTLVREPPRSIWLSKDRILKHSVPKNFRDIPHSDRIQCNSTDLEETTRNIY